jgi:phenylacetate-coenzyme A ligase PaaK-like adenylate-forming protein
MDVTSILDIDPYSLDMGDKQELLSKSLNELSQHHYKNSEAYQNMVDSIGYNVDHEYDYAELPFIPVRLFKMYDLISIPTNKIFKTMISSGTSGQSVSKIFLDKSTAANQTRVLAKIVSSFLGSQRVPMIIIDTESVVKNRDLFSARGAGILGFSMFGSKRMYALNDKMELNIDQIRSFVEMHKGQRIFLFGFTYMVYQHFYREIVQKGIELDLSDAVLIHGGGWKKLASESVSSKTFRENLKQVCGIQKVHDYYGMVEQTGSIYMECEYGHLHAPIYSDVIVRRASDFSIANIGEEGIIQVVSILPSSYPGHSLLTDDEGVILGVDDCKCGRLGKYFKIIGRVKNAELRGCSDTYSI